MFKRSRSKRARNQSFQSTLPSNFAQKVLDMETSIDTDCKIESIANLMQLYSVLSNQRAIQHYQSLNDQRYLHYQDRLQNLLMRKEVIKKLHKGDQNIPPLTENKKQNFQKRQHIRAQQLESQLIRKISSHRIAQSAIRTQKHQNQTACIKAKQCLRDQQDLNTRIAKRKRNNSLKPLKQEHAPPPQESFRNSLEKVIEKYAEEKLKMIMEIRIKYKDQRDEMRMMGENGIFQQVVEEMDRQMKNEIEIVTQEVNERREAELKYLQLVQVIQICRLIRKRNDQ